MKDSDKLNGYWEEGYHYYLEFRKEHLTVRNYRREIKLETTVSYDADALERGERTIITLEDNVLSRDYEGGMMTEIKELAYENGELKLLYYYTIMGETLYTLQKKDEGPFAHIRIRDEEFLEGLQGTWIQWTEKETRGKFAPSALQITGNEISWMSPKKERFHVVSYRYDPEKVYLVPENLTSDSFTGYTHVEVLPDMLTTTMMVCDMSMPLTVFARRDMLDKIKVPEAALRPARCTMGPAALEPPPPDFGMMGFMGMNMMQNIKPQPSAPVQPKPEPMPEPEVSSSPAPKFCPQCGGKLNVPPPKFCPDCGTKLT